MMLPWSTSSGAMWVRHFLQGRAFSSFASNLPPPKIKKLIVANRGEIACRVMQTARRLGIPTVAVFSDADRTARHVQMADEAFCIGGAAARDSYLKSDTILDVALRTGATALHPGYGFLSENAAFSERCAAAGVAFVGPPASAIRAMGNKSEAKRIMSEASVPVVPGYHGEEQAVDRLYAEASRIGFPLLVKAVSGGGGKGMKLAACAEQVPEALASARREAMSSFADDRVLLERYVQRPRHVEVQVFADTHGGAVYLFDRDCSVQRRHQKVIEEAPAPGLTPEFHKQIGEAAVRAARATGYLNAGTVEFILDTDSDEFFFMEMNTRLQVEHPITEAITCQDLVEWQLRVAAGERLPLTQEQLAVRGHAFEARIYAESPRNNFLPGAGQVRRWRPPRSAVAFTHTGGDVRVDSGVMEGDSVGTNYDPMIAKLVAWAPDRDQALAKLNSALKETQVAGLPTNVPFLIALSQHDAFRTAERLDTAFIDKHRAELFQHTPLPSTVAALAAVARYMIKASQSAAASSPSLGPWNIPDSKRMWHEMVRSYAMSYPEGDQQLQLQVTVKSATDFEVLSVPSAAAAAASPESAECVAVQQARLVAPDRLEAEVAGRRCTADVLLHATPREEVLNVWMDGGSYELRWSLPQWSKQASGTSSHGADAKGRVFAPMPGKIVKVLVKAGDVVAAGAPLVVMEAMKMEHTVVAPRGGTVAQMSVCTGGQVQDGQVLMLIEATPETAALADAVGEKAETANAATQAAAVPASANAATQVSKEQT